MPAPVDPVTPDDPGAPGTPVQQPVSPAPPKKAPPAQTGVEAGPQAWLAVLMLLSGAALAYAGRRRRTL